jgi:hypothetical protein
MLGDWSYEDKFDLAGCYPAETPYWPLNLGHLVEVDCVNHRKTHRAAGHKTVLDC